MNRASEVLLACVVAVAILPVMVAVGLAILILDGAPVFFVATRVSEPGRTFRLIKFRTMAAGPAGGVTGADKAPRISSLGRFLRRTRLDELPQIINILRGDIRFVGPRPPQAEHVGCAPELYLRVLRTRPGVTGLATLAFHCREESILARTHSPQDTDRVYRRRCIPRKARIDLIYARRRSLGLDLWLMALTVLRVFGFGGRGRLPRLRGRRRAAPWRRPAAQPARVAKG